MKLSERMQEMSRGGVKMIVVLDWSDEVAQLEDKLERQAEQITNTNDSIADRNSEVRKWKRLHHELGKRYALLKTVSEDVVQRPDEPGA